MATVEKQLVTRASVEAVWDAIRDVGALHTRLVPGFVIATHLEPGVRVVTFANGTVVREPIVTLDDARRRLVWSADPAGVTHYNASVEARPLAGGGTCVVWRADLLPNTGAPAIEAAMEQGMQAMFLALEQLANSEGR